MIVCTTCNDTHMMDHKGSVVMCTRCPVPCDRCRSGGNGPYCETTPCPCACHVADVAEAARKVANLLASASTSRASNPVTVDIEAERYNRIQEAIAAGLDGMGLHLASGDQCLPLDEDHAKLAIAGLARVVGLVL